MLGDAKGEDRYDGFSKTLWMMSAAVLSFLFDTFNGQYDSDLAQLCKCHSGPHGNDPMIRAGREGGEDVARLVSSARPSRAGRLDQLGVGTSDRHPESEARPQ